MRIMDGQKKVDDLIDSDGTARKVSDRMGFNDSMRIVRGGVDDVIAKLQGNPQRTVVQLTAHGRAMVNDEGVDGLKGEVLASIDEHGSSRTISQLSQDCHVPVMTIKRIVGECAKRNPPLVQIN